MLQQPLASAGTAGSDMHVLSDSNALPLLVSPDPDLSCASISVLPQMGYNSWGVAEARQHSPACTTLTPLDSDKP